jgi:hypothetical protein
MPPAAPKRPSRSKPPVSTRTALRNVLQGWNPPAGPNGFEGLVARALAEFTGYTFRLARSGSQFGRDAATPHATFSIAMEAKRYGKSVPLQELVGKASLAAFALAEGVDVWVLAATVEVSEPTQRQLAELLEEGGIALLTLDWTDASLPPLAVLLASTMAQVLPWAQTRLTAPKLAALRAGLEDVASDPAFETQRRALEQKLSPASVGLGAFRARNAEWLETRFGSRRQAQRDFSQFLAPLEAPQLSAERPTVTSALESAAQGARRDPNGDGLVAVLGGEGAGKSWAVATWWHRSDPRPILLLSIGRLADALSPDGPPLDTLARLAAHQEGRDDARTIARWRRRFERWSAGPASRDRFVVVLDGLNESSGKPWATIIQRLMPAINSIGGVLVVTCRERYWSREVAPRLPFLNVHTVTVGDYDDAEFEDVMGRNGVGSSALPSRLNRFMRNPRICALALTILPQLGTIDDLDVDRLLLEYWRARMLERGDLVGHDDEDLRDLLVRHAREYRDRPGTDFDRNEWRSRSGAAQRGDGRNLANDLSDIEEGRFFDAGTGSYRFRDETLHFSLGLLVADELRTAVAAAPDRADEALAAIVDPVRGFDMLGDILTAAIATAALDIDYPDAGLAALMSGLMSLQNLVDQAFDGLIPYVAARPEPFLDAFERRDLARDDHRFLELLLVAASRPTVAAALDLRIDRWLGSWSRASNAWGDPDEQGRRRAEREARIDESLASLTADELTLFPEMCPELPNRSGLAAAAAFLIHREPQARHARGIVAFAFAYTIAGDHRTPYDDVAWVVRLNRLDFPALLAAVRTEIAPLTGGEASATARTAAARALRLLGSSEAQELAEAISETPEHQSNLQGTPRVDPIDPDASAPEGVTEATARLSQIDPTAIWTHMSTTGEDHHLDRNLDLLTRFDPEGIAAYLDRVAGTVGVRSGMPLRQLGWHLPWLSPVISGDAISRATARITELGADPSLVPDGDHDFVTGMIVEGVLPRLDADAQLDLLQSLPQEAPWYLRYTSLAKPMTADEAASRLEAASSGETRALERALYFVAAHPTEMNERLRGIVIACVNSPDENVSGAAANLARNLGDEAIDDAVLGMASPSDDDDSWRAATVRSAIVSAIARRGREDLLGRVPPQHLDWVAARMPAARARLADAVEVAIARLIRPISSEAPQDASIVLEIGDDPFDVRTNVSDRGERTENSLEVFAEEMNDQTGERFASRQRMLHAQLERFLTSLTHEDALMVARRPYTVGLADLARDKSERYAGWLQQILATDDERSLRQLQNLGFALAQSYATVDPVLSARAFAHLWRVEPYVTVQIGWAKHRFRDLALFSATASEEISTLRALAFEEAYNDAFIERLTVAADGAGAGAWLDTFVSGRAASPLPSDQALALTIASFRGRNELSDDLLGREWGRGFLGEVARIGRNRYRTGQHADHWLLLAAEATTATEQWRMVQLATAASSRRHLLDLDPRLRATMRAIGGDMPQRLGKAAEKASKEAEKTLLGMRKPTGLLDRLMRS